MTRMHAAFGNLFTGKTIVITGAGNGIGKATALAFEDAGANVIAHLGRNKAYANELPNSITSWTGDFTQAQQQQAFIDFVKSTTGQLDVLINNAGTMFGRFPADTISDAQYDAIVELNQHAVVRITRALLPMLRQSTAASGGSPGSSIYSASKAFVSTYSRGLARELAPDGIRVNAVSPGVIDTDFHSRYSSAQKLEATRQQIPLQRLGTPEDCAPTFLFLSAPELSGYITGQVIEINGGQR
jgi:3-oxoacyl-[acyl-carrier protein] reductase